MLVLTRKPEEQITIGDGITITILATNDNRVALGIDAPRHMAILRTELSEAVADRANAGSVSAPQDTSKSDSVRV